MSLNNATSQDLIRLAQLGADLQAIDLPNGYKLTRKKVKVGQYVWHVSKHGWHIDNTGNVGDKDSPQSPVHHASISDALGAYDKHVQLKSSPNYSGWL
ncbi:MAG: hypothetical protein CTY38_01025 [Methylotenera sp.]|uniref:hypothetical protein n=1 Tax=Methylotenera sp. TaxID=2051956 RepID=UPI000D4F1705|nr:hypothetical protein [Methylotenera sp.]PPC84661.1 MAG: hypothetical protein CTY38_01025 [Methylotenera sp.]